MKRVSKFHSFIRDMKDHIAGRPVMHVHELGGICECWKCELRCWVERRLYKKGELKR